MTMLSRVEIRGYRSIKDAQVDLGPLNLIVGANGAGKSNFVSFFKMLNEMMGLRLQEYLGLTGRSASNMHFGSKRTTEVEGLLEFVADQGTNRYQFRLKPVSGDTLVFVEESLSFQRIGAVTTSQTSLGAGHLETRIKVAAGKNNKMAGVFRYLLDQCRVCHFHDTSATA